MSRELPAATRVYRLKHGRLVNVEEPAAAYEASNGYLVTGHPEGPVVCEIQGDSALAECQARVRMLWAVLEAVYGYQSKHDEFRVEVRVIDHNGRLVPFP